MRMDEEWRRRKRRSKDEDGRGVEEKERKTQAEMVGQSNCGLEGKRLSGERTHDWAVQRQLVTYIDPHNGGRRRTL